MVKSDTIQELFRLESQVERAVVSEIKSKFFEQNRIQFLQYMARLSEKCKSLETERNNLILKVKRAKLDMQRGDSTEKKEQAVSDQGNNLDQESSKEDVSQKITQTAGNMTPEKLQGTSLMEGQEDDQME